MGAMRGGLFARRGTPSKECCDSSVERPTFENVEQGTEIFDETLRESISVFKHCQCRNEYPTGESKIYIDGQGRYEGRTVLREFDLRRHCVSFVEVVETKGSFRTQEIFGVSSVLVGSHDVDVEKRRRCVQSSGVDFQWREALCGAVKVSSLPVTRGGAGGGR